MIEEFRADVTKARKDGSKDALRIDYGNGREPQEPVRWLWKYIDGAKTAGELYGRALVVIATSHLPASLRPLEAAVKRAHQEHDRATQRAQAAARRASRTEMAADESAGAAAQEEATDPETDVDVDIDEVEEADEAEQ